MTIIFDNTGFSVEYWAPVHRIWVHWTWNESEGILSNYPDETRRELLKQTYTVIHDTPRSEQAAEIIRPSTEVQDAVADTSMDIIALNRRQMSLGIACRWHGNNANLFRPDHHAIKDEKGQKNRWVTLKDTGSFLVWYVRRCGQQFIRGWFSRCKSCEARKEVWKKIFGLTKEANERSTYLFICSTLYRIVSQRNWDSNSDNMSGCPGCLISGVSAKNL